MEVNRFALQIHDPDFRDTGTRVERNLYVPVEAERGIAHFDE